MQNAKSGSAALARLRVATNPLIILLDWFIPGRTGERLVHTVGADAALAAKQHASIIVSAPSTGRLHLDAFPPALITARVHTPYVRRY